MHYDLIVKSESITSVTYKFYIKNFRSIIPYLYLSNNFNKYMLIITDENEDDICAINNNLLDYKKNPEFNRENLIIKCSNSDHIAWCDKYNLSHKLIEDKPSLDLKNKHKSKIKLIPKWILKKNYEPKIILKPAWAFNNKTIFNNYYSDENIRIIFIEGFEHHWDIMPYLNDNIYTFVQWCNYFNKWHFELARNVLYTLNKSYNKKNIIWMSPDLDGILWAYEHGFSAILFNHNAWLDYNTFSINNDKIIYDMVMNCRPEKNFKRPYLAKKIENLAYIKGSLYVNSDAYDYTELTCKYINKTRLNKTEVVDIYNKSYCGGIFSEKEGACYSSSEYLLCGLPVVSTYSRGGRDTWYTPNNSIIVESDELSVKKAVEKCITNIKNNTFNRKKIREDHIKLSNHMRDNFNRYVKYIFDIHSIKTDPYKYLNKNFRHKMLSGISADKCIKILTNDKV
jgi:glycosyltransferase involved in cell wall biosynthesis